MTEPDESTLRIGDEPARPGPGVFDPPTADETQGVSALEALRATLAAPVESEPVVIQIPKRPGVAIRCHTRMSQEQRKAWQQRSEDKRQRRRSGGERPVDEMKFATLVIANTCEAILMDGEEATDESSGNPLTFASKAIWDMVGAAEPSWAIRRLFANDAHVLIASGEVLLASGYDDDLEAGSDPSTEE